MVVCCGGGSESNRGFDARCRRCSRPENVGLKEITQMATKAQKATSTTKVATKPAAKPAAKPASTDMGPKNKPKPPAPKVPNAAGRAAGPEVDDTQFWSLIEERQEAIAGAKGSGQNRWFPPNAEDDRPRKLLVLGTEFRKGTFADKTTGAPTPFVVATGQVVGGETTLPDGKTCKGRYIETGIIVIGDDAERNGKYRRFVVGINGEEIEDARLECQTAEEAWVGGVFKVATHQREADNGTVYNNFYVNGRFEGDLEGDEATEV